MKRKPSEKQSATLFVFCCPVMAQLGLGVWFRWERVTLGEGNGAPFSMQSDGPRHPPPCLPPASADGGWPWNGTRPHHLCPRALHSVLYRESTGPRWDRPFVVHSITPCRACHPSVFLETEVSYVEIVRSSRCAWHLAVPSDLFHAWLAPSVGHEY